MTRDGTHLSGSQSLEAVVNIFRANFRDINLLLHQFTDSDYVFQVRETGRFVDDDIPFETRLAQYLFNYLSALSSLVDHTRNIVRQSPLPAETRAEYDRRVQEAFRDSSRAAFLKDLRNYMLHYRLPASVASWEEAHGDSRDVSDGEVILELDAMKDWERWSKESRVFMDGAGPRARLLPLVSQYADAVFALYRWLIPELAVSEARD